MTVNVLAQITAAPGKLDALLQHVKDLTNHAVKNEPGTLVYVPAQDPKDPTKVTIWEEYASEDAFNAHCALPPFVAFLAVKDEITTGELVIQRLNKIDVE